MLAWKILCRAQGRFDLGRVMCVVINNRNATDDAFFLETSVCAVEAQEPIGHDGSRDAEQIAGCKCGDGI